MVTCFYYDDSCDATFSIKDYYGSYKKYKELPRREYFKLFEDHIIRFIFIDENSICVVLEPTDYDKEICRKYREENERKIRENAGESND